MVSLRKLFGTIPMVVRCTGRGKWGGLVLAGKTGLHQIFKGISEGIGYSVGYEYRLPSGDRWEITEKIVQIKQRLQAARDHQKSYANVTHGPLEFQVGDKVMLKVSPWKGDIRFGKRGKLNPRYIGSFKVLAKAGTIGYRHELPQQLSRFHLTFHVTNLKKCLSNEPLAIPLDELHVDDKLRFVEELVEIMDREIKRFRKSHIPIIKVKWNSKRGLSLLGSGKINLSRSTPISSQIEHLHPPQGLKL
nr:putative reverse transcriptase domain-containing protein [Tanacetum cinerariifolium]